SADGLRLAPHIPASVTELEQLDAARFGQKRLYLSIAGNGPITQVKVNGRQWKWFDAESVFLPYEKTPKVARIQIARGGASLPATSAATVNSSDRADEAGSLSPDLTALREHGKTWRSFAHRLTAEGLGDTYEAAHARLACEAIEV